MTIVSHDEGRETRPFELEHRYGDRVHILDSASLQSVLARLGSPRTSRREVTHLLRLAYEFLAMTMAARELPVARVEEPTRMTALHPEVAYRGPALDPTTRIVIVDVIRGGILPAQHCFDLLEMLVPEDNVRLDHLNLSRRADASGRVVGVDLTGSKVGGSVDDAILVIPDPMGATGSTIVRVVEHYLAEHGRPSKIVAMPMIATPEFFRAVLPADPSLVVYTGRLDRGASPREVLESVPGTHPDRESGLDANDYIVPGAGGIGELLNNSWC